MKGRAVTVLKNEHKAFLVQRLALFDTPSQAGEALKAKFGLPITPQRAEAYNPERRAGAKLSGVWRLLFEQTRVRFLDSLKEVPVPNCEVGEMARWSRIRNALGQPDLAPFQQAGPEVERMTDEELAAEYRLLLGRKMSLARRQTFSDAFRTDHVERPVGMPHRHRGFREQGPRR